MFLSPRMGRNTNEHCQNEDRVPNKVHPSKPKLRPLPCLVSCVLVLSCFHILLLSCVNAILCKNASDSEWITGGNKALRRTDPDVFSAQFLHRNLWSFIEKNGWYAAIYEHTRPPTFPALLYLLIHLAVPTWYNLLFLCIVINSEHKIHYLGIIHSPKWFSRWQSYILLAWIVTNTWFL